MFRPRTAWAAIVAIAAFLANSLAAAEVPPKSPTAADLIPDSALIYIEASGAKELLSFALDNPVLKQLQQVPEFKQALESKDFQEFLAVVGLVEGRAGVKWRSALETITGGGLAVAFDPASQGLVVLSKSDDAHTVASVREALFGLIREDAKGKGQPDPIQSKDYRGLTAFQMGDALIADLGTWLMISNKPPLAKTIADQFLDGGKALRAGEEFAAARKLATNGNAEAPAAWGYLRLNALRTMGVAKGLLNAPAKSDNPGVELILGGLLSTLQKSPFVTAALHRDGPNLKLSIASPHDLSWVPKERRFYFGHADAPLRPSGTALSITTHRDLMELWQAAPDLFNEGIAGQLAKADSDLSTFLGGKSFSTDILGALEPQMQWITVRQDFKAAGVPAPAIRLPSTALVFRIKDGKAKTVQRSFRLAFHTLIAFTNVDGATKRRPMLETGTQTRGSTEILYATYETEDAKAPEKTATTKPSSPAKTDSNGTADAATGKTPADDVYYNFSPALVLSDDYLMLCSTRRIAEQLTDLAAARNPDNDSRIEANTLVEADGGIVAEYLTLNREQLIAQNMLEKGHDHAAAAREIDLLIMLVDFVKKATVRLSTTDDAVRLDVELKTD